MNRVLVVSSTFPQYPGDTRGEFILRRWEARAGAGECVRVLAPYTAWCDQAVSETLDVQRFRYAPRAWSSLTGRFGVLENIRERPWRAVLLVPYLVALTRALRRQLRIFAPDRVVAHMLLPSGMIVARECSRRRVQFELSGHGTDVDMLLRAPRWFRAWYRARMLEASAVRFPSHDKLFRVVRGLGFDCMPPCFCVDTMAECVPRPSTQLTGEGLALDDRPILYMGRLIKQKGVDDLIVAASLLRPRSKLAIAGDGPERTRLQALAHRLGVDSHFYGWVSGGLKAALFRAARVLCVPSRELPNGLSEGAPLVIAEALGYDGLSIVASAVGGIPELCGGHERARLVPPDRPDQLAHAMATALAWTPPSSTAHRATRGGQPTSVVSSYP